MRHGTTNGYTRHACRCVQCTDAHRRESAYFAYQRFLKLETSDVEHGKTSTYKNWGCRCDPCKAASTEAARVYRAKTNRSKP